MSASSVALSNSLQPFIDKVGGRQRAMLIGVGIIVAATIFGVSRWATAPEWIPAFTNQPMESVGKMTEKLQQAGIQYKLGNGGSDILVATKDVANARVTLAKDGLPVTGRPGLELFDQPSWGMTDFTQRINYRRALEGELERTIGQMRGVEAAQVHLALHEQSNFRRQDKPANASVVLKTNGIAPPPDVVQGIAHLVASSVDGLVSDRVTVLDDSGRLLSQPNDNGSLAALSNVQLSAQRDVEQYLQTKAEGLVGDIVGAGNARVRVTAMLNFDKIDRQSQLVDPERQATSTEQRYEITPGAEGGAASSNVAMSYDNSHVTENFSGAIGNIKRLSVAVLVNDKLVEPALDSAGKAVAAPTYIARTTEEIAHIESLVRSAVGADETRGDVVTVVSTRLDGTSIIDQMQAKMVPTAWDRVEQFQKPGIAVLGFITALAALFIVLRAVGGNKETQPNQIAASEQQPLLTGHAEPSHNAVQSTDSGSGVLPAAVAVDSRNPATFVDRNNVRRSVVATIEQKPEVSIRAVRAWMKEA